MGAEDTDRRVLPQDEAGGRVLPGAYRACASKSAPGGFPDALSTSYANRCASTRWLGSDSRPQAVTVSAMSASSLSNDPVHPMVIPLRASANAAISSGVAD